MTGSRSITVWLGWICIRLSLLALSVISSILSRFTAMSFIVESKMVRKRGAPTSLGISGVRSGVPETSSLPGASWFAWSTQIQCYPLFVSPSSSPQGRYKYMFRPLWRIQALDLPPYTSPHRSCSFCAGAVYATARRRLLVQRRQDGAQIPPSSSTSLH